MTPDIFDIVALVIIFLCYCAGRYWLGPSDAKKASIKHDGRRFVIRAVPVIALCAFIASHTSYGWIPAGLTVLSAGLAMGIGVRLGWNAARGLDWRYLGSTSADDWWWIRKVGGEAARWDHTFNYRFSASYTKAVHRAGLIRTIVELTTALALAGVAIWMN